MKTFVIGDIHGCFEQFQKLLEVINPDLSIDRLIMLGDYIDRGPNSYLTLQKVSNLQKEFGDHHVVLLRGNHEQMALDYLHNPNYRSHWRWNGGDATLADFQKHGDDLANYEGFLQGLRFYFEDDHFVYVHGGIRQGIRLSQQKASDLLWLREEFFLNPVSEKKPVIFGHTPTRMITGAWKPFIHQNRIGLDTGCIYGGFLSAAVIEEGVIQEIRQVENHSAA
ncbi:MAG: metallophosphoesterase family protein [Bacillota bacterium]|nr:metallophosphoesterase family protein [Bacillota bacterium]